VPVRLIGRRVWVLLHPSDLVIYDCRVEVARHERLMAKSSACLALDHYLEALVRKPGARPGATALEQARSAGKFTPTAAEQYFEYVDCRPGTGLLAAIEGGSGCQCDRGCQRRRPPGQPTPLRRGIGVRAWPRPLPLAHSGSSGSSPIRTRASQSR
jgi:hypothetical protein